MMFNADKGQFTLANFTTKSSGVYYWTASVYDSLLKTDADSALRGLLTAMGFTMASDATGGYYAITVGSEAKNVSAYSISKADNFSKKVVAFAVEYAGIDVAANNPGNE